MASLRQGRDTIVATPTASGKSFIYWLPVMERLIENPGAKALFVFPLKALEQDQLRGLNRLARPWPRPEGPISGPRSTTATPPPRPKKNQGSAPGNHHHQPGHAPLRHPGLPRQMGLLLQPAGAGGPGREPHLPGHLRLPYRPDPAEDEADLRMLRLGPHLSALLGHHRQPGKFRGHPPGREVAAVSRSGAPSSSRSFMFLNPELSAPHTAARLLVRAVRAGLKTIVFTQARKVTELIHMWSTSWEPGLKVSSYRAGFLPSERRSIERRLASGELDGVVSTSPWSWASTSASWTSAFWWATPGPWVTTWQRAGRVGRADLPSAVVLIAQPDALDQYIVPPPGGLLRPGLRAGRGLTRRTPRSRGPTWSAPRPRYPFPWTTRSSTCPPRPSC